MAHMPHTREIVDNIQTAALQLFGKAWEDTTPVQKYKAVAQTVKNAVMEKWAVSRTEEGRPAKRLYYLSVEFLMGRALINNIINLCLTKEYSEALEKLGISLYELEEKEADAGLGNGGLGRLAACFLDSLASLGLPATGCGIRYEYGLFRQRIEDGYQVEAPDNWLGENNVWEWEVPFEDDAVEVRFGGTIKEEWKNGKLEISHTGYSRVIAVPYDVPVVGYEGKMVNNLRLWSARAVKPMDMACFSRGEYVKAIEERELAEVISKVLYPEDNHIQGKTLRLRQQYFFASATIQHILSEFKKTGETITRLPEHVTIQINDTHPSLAIPEMMRLLIDEEGCSWETAWDIVTRTFAYTNHTVMWEALEVWPETLIAEQTPRVHTILIEINRRYTDTIRRKYPGQQGKADAMAIIQNGNVKMAYLSIAGSKAVNGVSQIHGQILRNEVFSDFYGMEPGKFKSITNGITHRRWLMKANPELTELITDCIGEDWITQPSRLAEFAEFTGDREVQERFMAIKLANKLKLAGYLKEKQGVDINIDSIFDVQAKRLHEYKRQTLNILHVLHLYNKICDNPDGSFTPVTFIFAAKAAPGYERAKLIIKLINSAAELVNSDPRCKGKLQVVFLENYGVSPAEVLIPATDISEQLSTAGKEASGTGNMKFMMNGAVTLGTLDGANIEIKEAVGAENIFIFGLTAEETARMSRYGLYSPGKVYETNTNLRKALERLIEGPMKGLFSDIYQSLLYSDVYYVLQDFESYALAHEKAVQAYSDRHGWAAKCMRNTAMSGVFSSDRSIAEYNEQIWKLRRVDP